LANPTKESAAFVGKDGVLSGFPVDAGMISICDEQVAKEYKDFINEWYEDIELYNLIGYIIMAKKNSQSFNWIVSAINGYRSSTSKKAFKQNFLIKEIKN